MEKLRFSEIRRRIDNRIETIPLTLKYEKSSEEYPESQPEQTSFDGEIIPTISTFSKFQKKTNFIYTVIHTNTYFNKKGRQLSVTDEEIQTTYNKYIRLVEALEHLQNLEEFAAYLYPQARQVLVDEQTELENFENGSLLDQLLHKDKYLITLRNYIIHVGKKLGQVNRQANELFNALRQKKITGLMFDAEIDKIDESYHLWRVSMDSALAKYKKQSESGVQRRRLRLKRCFRFADLHSPEPIINPPLIYSNITIATFLIEEYCRWYNAGIAEELDAARRAKETTTKRIKRAEGKQETLQYRKKQERIALITPHLNSNISDSEIARLTGIPKSTVQRILSEIRSN